jgi:hypothetical protein
MPHLLRVAGLPISHHLLSDTSFQAQSLFFVECKCVAISLDETCNAADHLLSEQYTTFNDTTNLATFAHILTSLSKP